MGAWAQGWQTGENIEAQRRARQQQLQDEQRQAKEAALQNQLNSGAITAGQYGQGLNDLYAHEPAESRLGRIGRGLERAVGMRKKADAQKQQADAKLAAQPSPRADFARIEAGAKTPQQLAEEKATATTQQGIKGAQAAYDTYLRMSPGASEDNKRVMAALLGVPNYRPTTDEMQRQDYQAALAGGYQGSNEQWKAEQAAKGRAAGSPAKTPQFKPGVSGGKNVFAYYNTDQKAWLDSNTQQPLADFRPAPNFAQTGLYGLDTGYDSQGNPVPVLLDRRSGRVVPAPSGIVAPPQAKGIEGQRTAAIAGDALLRTMMGAADRAKAGDQQAMLSIVANHIGMTLGAQKGARINQAVWNEATESAPWLANIEKSFGPDGYLQGVKLSPQQIDQMVELGKLRRDVMWEQASQTAAAAGVNLLVPQFQLYPVAAGPAPKAGQTVAPQGGGNVENWVRDPKTGKLVKQ